MEFRDNRWHTTAGRPTSIVPESPISTRVPIIGWNYALWLEGESSSTNECFECRRRQQCPKQSAATTTPADKWKSSKFRTIRWTTNELTPSDRAIDLDATKYVRKRRRRRCEPTKFTTGPGPPSSTPAESINAIIHVSIGWWWQQQQQQQQRKLILINKHRTRWFWSSVIKYLPATTTTPTIQWWWWWWQQ